jgi:hypothetical protein
LIVILLVLPADTMKYRSSRNWIEAAIRGANHFFRRIVASFDLPIALSLPRSK